MRKSLLNMFLLSAIGMTANAQKSALIDVEYTLKNIFAYQSAAEELDQASRQWQSKVEKLGKEAKGLYNNYQASTGTLSDAQKSEEEEKIVAKEKSAAELRRKYFDPEGELIKKREALMQPIQDEIYEAVKAISTQKGYTVVVDRASAPSITFASPNIDISNEVFVKLGYSNQFHAPTSHITNNNQNKYKYYA